MKTTTRDNIVYLAVGLGAVAALALDVFYSLKRGHNMWNPSLFEERAITATLVMEGILADGLRKERVPFRQILIWLFFATILHIGFLLLFRQFLGGTLLSSFALWAILEVVAVIQITQRLRRYVASESRSRRVR
jgi:hypothetical protein